MRTLRRVINRPLTVSKFGPEKLLRRWTTRLDRVKTGELCPRKKVVCLMWSVDV